jgi:hypothetical protein
MKRMFSVAAVLTALVSVDGSAASGQTFRACRVPGVGAIYMIGVAGAPTACLDAAHVEFQWTEGGGPGIAFAGINVTGVNVNSATNVATVTLTIPAAGFVTVRFDGILYQSNLDQIVLAASNTSGTWFVNDGNVTLPTVSGPQPFSHTRTYAVTAGTQTFYAVVEQFSGTGPATVSIYASLTATYYPSRY